MCVGGYARKLRGRPVNAAHPAPPRVPAVRTSPTDLPMPCHLGFFCFFFSTRHRAPNPPFSRGYCVSGTTVPLRRGEGLGRYTSPAPPSLGSPATAVEHPHHRSPPAPAPSSSHIHLPCMAAAAVPSR